MLTFLFAVLFFGTAEAARIKDVASLYGSRDNMLFG